ncbi:phosphatidylinositol transfer protein 2-like, partial [Lepeophtheirus salmonis]|uniref:phosphatidylinositol transfer protein 2-like n=1 Tax=Lepeophtheirus salmonis TaxID=72036 RepID=UPI001AE3709C
MKRKQSFVIPVPLSIEQFTLGYRYSLCKVFLEEVNSNPDKASKINIIACKNLDDNSEFGECKYTEKLIDVAPKVPAIVTSVLSRKAFIMREKSFNNFIKCRTEYN